MEQLQKHSEKMTALREDLELQRKTEIHEIEEVHTYVCTYGICSKYTRNLIMERMSVCTLYIGSLNTHLSLPFLILYPLQ